MLLSLSKKFHIKRQNLRQLSYVKRRTFIINWSGIVIQNQTVILSFPSYYVLILRLVMVEYHNKGKFNELRIFFFQVLECALERQKSYIS